MNCSSQPDGYRAFPVFLWIHFHALSNDVFSVLLQLAFTSSQSFSMTHRFTGLATMALGHIDRPPLLLPWPLGITHQHSDFTNMDAALPALPLSSLSRDLHLNPGGAFLQRFSRTTFSVLSRRIITIFQGIILGFTSWSSRDCLHPHPLQACCSKPEPAVSFPFQCQQPGAFTPLRDLHRSVVGSPGCWGWPSL